MPNLPTKYTYMFRTAESEMFCWQDGFLADLNTHCDITGVIVLAPVYVVVSGTTHGNRHRKTLTSTHATIWRRFGVVKRPRSKARAIILCERPGCLSQADRGAWQILSGSPPRVFASTASRKTPVKSETRERERSLLTTYWSGST